MSEPRDGGDNITILDGLKQERDDEAEVRVTGAATMSGTDTDDSRIFHPEESMDVTELSGRANHCQDLDDLLQDPRLDQVKKLDGVNCEIRPAWCKKLLQRVAPRVQWLYVFEALREHLDVIKGMPALRYVHVHMCQTDGGIPELPVQLQELMVENVTASHFQSLQRMPDLRKLQLHWSEAPLDVTSPPLPPHHRGLQWLWVALRPLTTTLSLAKAHAATLQELRVLCASEGKTTPWHFQELADGLRQCGLAALRRVVLLRRPAPTLRRHPHSRKSCELQKKDVRDKLLADGSARTVKAVQVLCEECDDVPEFPDLGDFEWKD